MSPITCCRINGQNSDSAKELSVITPSHVLFLGDSFTFRGITIVLKASIWSHTISPNRHNLVCFHIFIDKKWFHDWDLILGRGRDYFFFFATTSRPTMGLTHPPIWWVLGDLSLREKWQGHEADHLPSSSAEVKGCVELCLHSHNTP